MDERLSGIDSQRARAPAPVRAGLWDRPAVLDLVSDLLMLFVALALGYALVIWFLSRPMFPLREVVVLTPPGQVTLSQMEYAARSSIQGNFFLVRLEDVRAAFEKLPWVRRAEVRRRWPDAIELRLEEHQAVAYWSVSDSDEMHLVNRQGEVFVAASNANMPDFSGPPGSAAYLLARHGEFVRTLEPLGVRPVGVWLSAREAWRLVLDNGMVLVLGRDQNEAPIAARMQRFVSAWPEAQERVGVQVARVDLRYQRGFALTLAGQDQATKGKQ